MTLRKGDLLAAAQQGDRAAGEELLRENDKRTCFSWAASAFSRR